MLYRENPPNVFKPWTGEKIGGIWHPPEIETAWPAADLEALKLFIPAAAEPASEGARIVSTSVKRVDGIVRLVHEIAPVTSESLLEYARQKRWEKEVGGISVAGVAVATDDRSQTKIIGARVAADADPAWATIWSGSDGGLYPLDAAAMVAISNAVQAHVNSCFTIYATVADEIENGIITDVDAINEAFA